MSALAPLRAFAILLDVSALDGDVWDAWCEAELPPGIDTCGLQPHGGEDGDAELWIVTAEDEARARDLALEGIGDYAVEVRRVRPATERDLGG